MSHDVSRAMNSFSADYHLMLLLDRRYTSKMDDEKNGNSDVPDYGKKGDNHGNDHPKTELKGVSSPSYSNLMSGHI